MLLASAVMVVWSKNPVHSVLFLILAFFNAAGLFVLLGAEFLGMLLVIVYVGAVDGAVPVRRHDARRRLRRTEGRLHEERAARRPGRHHARGRTDLVPDRLGGVAGTRRAGGEPGAGGRGSAGLTNTEAIGRVLYTDYVYFFEVAGLILLTAMIGAIVLTLRHKEGVRRQSIPAQNARTPAKGMAVVTVKPGEAVVPASAQAGGGGGMSAIDCSGDRRRAVEGTASRLQVEPVPAIA